MKGVIFKHFESFVGESFGFDVFEEILESTQLQTRTAFVGPETYPDEDLVALLTTAVQRLGISPADALEAFGKYLFGRLVTQHPDFVERVSDLKSFLLTVEDVIHVEVRKLFPGAVTPSFEYEDTAPDRLVIRYRSPRKLCALFRGLLQGAAERFEQPVSYEELACLHEGADACCFDITIAQSQRKAG
ncbi:MAG: heme NO-binding domain-containing protein [Planctomycetota bacterium]